MVDPIVDEAELLRQATESDLVRRGLRMSEDLLQDPRLQSMLTVDRETYQSREAGLPVDSEGGRTFIDIFDDSFELMHGYKRAQYNRNFLFGQHPAFNFIAEAGRSLGVLTGLSDQQPDFSDREGFMGADEEWKNNQQFRLDATRLRFRKFEDFDGSKNSSLEYLIDPQYFKTIPGLKGQYITPESIPKGEVEQFRKVANSPSAALAYFEQRTGKAIYNYLKDSTSVKSSVLSRRGNELLLEMTQPDVLAEDLLLFGALNMGGKLVRFGKNFKRVRNEPAAVHKTTRRTLFGDDAVDAVRAGKADEITDAWGKLKGAARGPAVATPVSGLKTSVGMAAIFGGTELARQRMIVENRSLLGERDIMTEGVLLASVIGLVGGKFTADQVNQGIPTQQLRSLFDATEIEVTNQLKIRAEQKGVPVEALTDNDRDVAVQRSMEKIQQKTDEMEINLEGGVGDKVIKIADRLKKLPGLSQLTGSEAHLTIHAEEFSALNTVLGKVAMDIARPEGQQVKSLAHDSIVNLRLVDHHMGAAVEQIEKNIEVSVDPSLSLHPEQVTPQALWRVSGEIAGELAIESDSILDEQALIQRFKQEGLILTENGAKAVKRAVGHIRSALEPEVQKMLDSGFLNRELTDINPYHAARVWNEVALETADGKEKLRALFRDYLKKHKYTRIHVGGKRDYEAVGGGLSR